MMAIADKFAMVSASMKVQLRLDEEGRILSGEQLKKAGEAAAASARRAAAAKRKDPQPDSVLVTSVQVAAVDEEPADSGSNQCQKTTGAWKPRQSYREMLDGPCSHHSGIKPATHTTRNCAWTRRMVAGDGLGPAPARATQDGRLQDRRDDRRDERRNDR